MNRIISNHANSHTYNPSLIQSMYHLRDRIFKGRLGWDVTCVNGKEKDYFDDLEPAYLMYCNKYNQIEGCCRILPTTGPYMLKDIFPELLRGETLPEDQNIFEISRFAILPKSKHQRLKGNLNEITFDLLKQIYDFGAANKINRYVVVTSVAMERMLRLVGIPTTRFGDGKATKIGKVLSVCVWLDINDQYRDAVYSQFIIEKEAA